MACARYRRLDQRSGDIAFQVAAVPEPASVPLALAGLLVLGAAAARRRRAR